MKKFLIAIVAAIILSLPAEAKLDVTSFVGLGWEATRQEVVERYNGTIQKDGNVTSVMQNETSSTSVVFVFVNNRLDGVMFTTFLKTGSLQDIANTCTFIAKGLIEENGPAEFLRDQANNLVLTWQSDDTVAMFGCREVLPGGPVLMIRKKAKVDTTL